MPGPHPSVALTRLAVRYSLRRLIAEGVGCVVVGVSGGADSLALAGAVAFEAPRLGLEAAGVVVDHGLQDGSAAVAEGARDQCVGLGLKDTRVERVVVSPSSDGLEAAARRARYDALNRVAGELDPSRILLAHTADDQAEQVLLGLLRGSGLRSIAGMRPERGRLVRPFLLGPGRVPGGPVRREHTVQACEALGLTPWQDPHNADLSFRRVQARRALRLLSEELGAPALSVALHRSAASAARDADFLDAETGRALVRLTGTDRVEDWPSVWPVEALTGLDPAIRIRALRRVLVLHGARDSELASRHLLDVESLLVNWHGQGPIHVPGGIQARRSGGELLIEPRTRDNSPAQL